MNIFNRLSKWIQLKFKSLRVIIGTSMSLVASMTLLLFVLLMVMVIRETLITGVKTNAEQSTHLSYVTLTNKHTDMIRKASILADEIQHIHEETGTLEDVLSMGYRLNDEIVSLSLFDESGHLVKYAPAHYTAKKELNLLEQNWFQEPGDHYSFTFSPPHIQEWFQTPYQWVVTLNRKITIDSIPYYLVIDYDFSSISDYINRVFIGKRGYSFILDENNNIIYHPYQRMAQKQDEEGMLDLIQNHGDGVYITPDQRYVIAYQTVPQSHWKVVGVSHLPETLQPTIREIGRFTLGALLFILLFVILLSLIVSKTIAGPITNIVRTMKNTDGKLFSTKIKEHSYSEVEALSQTYNTLLDQVNDLMVKVKEEQVELRHSEMNVLQSQINPHFLYNTLDSILWMAERGNTKETSDMVAALGKLMRISLSKGDMLIPFHKEIEHAKSYLTIQKIRYRDQFTYTFDIEESLLDVRVPKITIQPFLENALYHGIERMADEGQIDIKAISDGNDIILTISDDGGGILPESLVHIQAFDIEEKSGFGIRNVHQRIRLLFGEEYGVTIESEMDEGTTVMIRMPKSMAQEGERAK